MTVLITGGAGFIGCNLADRLASDGHDVLVLDSLVRPGVAANLDWLKQRHPGRVTGLVADIRDPDAVARAVRMADVVFHLAAQVAVTTSLTDPLADFQVNVAGTLNLLEALRRRRDPAPLIMASTNKVYGDLADIALTDQGGRWLPVDPALRDRGVSEDRALDFHTPYGCSKGAADQYVLDYARSFGMQTAVLRMSCIYGTRQRGTEDQGWVAHFLFRALRGERITLFGDGRQVRDVLFIDDAVAAYLAAWRNIGAISGRAFNLGGGPANAISLLQLLAVLEQILECPVQRSFEPWRPGDQRWFVADTTAARRMLHLPEPMNWLPGLQRMCAWASNLLPLPLLGLAAKADKVGGRGEPHNAAHQSTAP